MLKRTTLSTDRLISLQVGGWMDSNIGRNPSTWTSRNERTNPCLTLLYDNLDMNNTRPASKYTSQHAPKSATVSTDLLGTIQFPFQSKAPKRTHHRPNPQQSTFAPGPCLPGCLPHYTASHLTSHNITRCSSSLLYFIFKTQPHHKLIMK